MPTISKAKTFPKGAVLTALTAALLAEAKRKLKHESKPVPADVMMLRTKSIVLDSLGVVEILMIVEPIAKCELPETIVRAGGYNSVDEAVKHIMPRIEDVWKRKTK